jgi:hypothetical protein
MEAILKNSRGLSRQNQSNARWSYLTVIHGKHLWALLIEILQISQHGCKQEVLF